jgi:hypothetical protein
MNKGAMVHQIGLGKWEKSLKLLKHTRKMIDHALYDGIGWQQLTVIVEAADSGHCCCSPNRGQRSNVSQFFWHFTNGYIHNVIFSCI